MGPVYRLFMHTITDSRSNVTGDVQPVVPVTSAAESLWTSMPAAKPADLSWTAAYVMIPYWLVGWEIKKIFFLFYFLERSLISISHQILQKDVQILQWHGHRQRVLPVHAAVHGKPDHASSSARRRAGNVLRLGRLVCASGVCVCVFFFKYMREKRRFGVCITVVSPSTTEKPIQHYAFLNFPQSQPCSREISQLTPPALPSQLSTTFCCWMRWAACRWL